MQQEYKFSPPCSIVHVLNPTMTLPLKHNLIFTSNASYKKVDIALKQLIRAEFSLINLLGLIINILK